MPLKRKEIKQKEVKINEGSVLQTPDKTKMSLFEKAKLPLVTLNAKQFQFPETFLVMDAKRVKLPEINPETGWNLKSEAGQTIYSEDYGIQLHVADGDAAQTLVDSGLPLTGLSTLQLTIIKDIPIQSFEPESTLLKPKGLVVMLGFGGQSADRIILKCDDVELV